MTNMINWDAGADGVVTLTMDDPNQRANTMNDTFRQSLDGHGRPAVSGEGLDRRRHRHLGQIDLLRRR